MGIDETYRGFLDPDEPKQQQRRFQFSLAGDIAVPLGVALCPIVLSSIASVVMAGAVNAKGKIPEWMLIAGAIVQVLMIVAMAVVVLVRLEAYSKKLVLFSDGPPRRWRRFCMLVALGGLTLFDLMVNVAGLFPGAEFFYIAAVPMFAGYLLFIQLAFAGLHRPTSLTTAE